MAFFHSAERRQAAAFLDTTIAETHAMLEDASLRAHEKTARSLLERLVPVFLDNAGIVPMPKRAQQDDFLIPIAAVSRGQTITLSQEYNRMNTPQIKSVAAIAKGWGVSEGLIDDLSNDMHGLPLMQRSIKENNAGFVANQALKFGIASDRMGKTPYRLVRGRPFVGLVDAPLANPALTLFHEIVHTQQAQLRPITNADAVKAKKDNQSRELEAYVRTGNAANTLYFESTNPKYHQSDALCDANWLIYDIWAKTTEFKKTPGTLWEPQGKVLNALQAAELTLTQ